MSLRDIKEHCLTHQIPCISPATENFLRSSLQEHTPHIVCEIGSAAGYSSIMMARTIASRGGKIISYEISYPQYKKCIQHKSDMHCHNWSCYHVDGTKATTNVLQKCIGGEIDYAFIDAQKSEYHTFLRHLLPLMKPGGHIVCDDCIKYRSKMTTLYRTIENLQLFTTVHHLDDDDGILIIHV